MSQADLRRIDNKIGEPSWTEMGLYRYPENLGGTEEPHYVTFEINIRGKTSQAQNAPAKIRYEVTRNSQTAAGADISSTTLRGAASVASGAAAGAAVTGIARSITKAIAKTGQVSGKAKTALAVGGALTGAAAGTAVGSAVMFGSILKPDKIFRITDYISLQLDGPPSVKYGMQYANKDLGTLIGLLSGGSFENNDFIKGTSAAAQAVGLQFAKLPGAFGAGDLSSAIGKAAGVALNPFREVIFEAVDFRSFQFKYKFLPKSAEETRSIKKIIELFRYHMHPELHSSKLFFIYPAEFQITYWYKGTENPFLFKFRPVVLESMDVNYGGETFTSFKDGAPTEINLTLLFRETEILTKNLFDSGEA